jgi:histone H3/H4
LKNERTRLAEDAVVALTITVEETLRQLIKHTVAQTFADGLKTLMVEHIHRGCVENLDLYPLFKNLPSFASEAARHRNFNSESEWNAKLKAALTQAEREFKKKYKLPPKSVAKPEAPKADAKAEPAKEVAKPEAAEPVAEAPKSAEESDGPTSIHFIKKLFDDMSEHEPAYKAARLSKPYKQYLAQLANELVSYLAPLISIVAGAMKTKTVSKAAVLCVVKSLLVAGRPTVDKFELCTMLQDDAEFARAEATKKKAVDQLEKTVEDKLQQKHSKKEVSA